MLNSIGRIAQSWADRFNPWSNVYGLARSLLAAGTALTLIFNKPGLLFRPASGLMEYPVCQNPWKFGLFCVCSSNLGLARWIGVAILIVAASGWRPRWTALPHWWVAFSLQTSAITLDGGDQVAAVLSLLILPIALTDTRRWHWQPISPPTSLTTAGTMKRLLALSTLLIVQIQVAGIYLHAAVAKWSVAEWSDGTILYYWFNDPFVGSPAWLKPLMMPVLTTPAVALFTWTSLILELLLFAAVLMPKRRRWIMLIAGILFHSAIAVTMGLISFGLAMTAALVLYLRPFDHEFKLRLPQITLPRPFLWLRRVRLEETQSPEGVTTASAL